MSPVRISPFIMDPFLMPASLNIRPEIIMNTSENTNETTILYCEMSKTV